jgi:hypothetical protein
MPKYRKSLPCTGEFFVHTAQRTKEPIDFIKEKLYNCVYLFESYLAGVYMVSDYEQDKLIKKYCTAKDINQLEKYDSLINDFPDCRSEKGLFINSIIAINAICLMITFFAEDFMDTWLVVIEISAFVCVFGLIGLNILRAKRREEFGKTAGIDYQTLKERREKLYLNMCSYANDYSRAVAVECPNCGANTEYVPNRRKKCDFCGYVFDNVRQK